MQTLTNEIPREAPAGKDIETARLTAMIGFYAETLAAYNQESSELRRSKRATLRRLYSGYRHFRETDLENITRIDSNPPEPVRRLLSDLYSFLHSSSQKAYALRGDYQLRFLRDWSILRPYLHTMYLSQKNKRQGVQDIPPVEYFIYQPAQGEVHLERAIEPGSEVLILSRALGRCHWSLHDGDLIYNAESQSIFLPSNFSMPSRPKSKVTCPGLIPHQLYWLYYVPRGMDDGVARSR